MSDELESQESQELNSESLEPGQYELQPTDDKPSSIEEMLAPQSPTQGDAQDAERAKADKEEILREMEKYYSREDAELIHEETERLIKENDEILERLRREQEAAEKFKEAKRQAQAQTQAQTQAQKNEVQMKITPKKVPADQVNKGGSNAGGVQKEAPKTFYVNVLDFVMSYLSVIFGTETTQTAKRIWLNDWWRYPAVVSRINALWMAWEKSYKANQIETWFLHIAEPMMRGIMDKETGILVHYVAEDSSNLFVVRKGEKLPTITPPNTWYKEVANQIQSLGRLELKKYEEAKAARLAAQNVNQNANQNGGAANG
jgi:actin-related protein